MDEHSVAYWDDQAATFDEAPDHGLRDPVTRAAWADLLLPVLPEPSAVIADLGCGTGTLSVLLAEAGHVVHGLDLSARMIAAARVKAAGRTADFRRGDASLPPLTAGAFDVVLARHVLWALPDPAAALDRWVALLRPGGRLVLIEGLWWTGSGLSASACRALVLGVRREAGVRRLDDPVLWGGPINDERYLLLSRR